jgi:hypothetical protein
MTFQRSEGKTPVNLIPLPRDVAGTWISPVFILAEYTNATTQKTGFYVQFKQQLCFDFAFHFRTVQYSLEQPLRIQKLAYWTG